MFPFVKTVFGVHDDLYFSGFQPQRFGAFPVAVQYVLQVEIASPCSNAWKTTSDIPGAVDSRAVRPGDIGRDASSWPGHIASPHS